MSIAKASLQIVTCRSPRNGNVVAAASGTEPWQPFGDWNAKPDLSDGEIELCARLLAAGGKYVLWPAGGDEDLAHYLARGQVFTPDKVLLRRGCPNQCHANAAELWYRHDTYQIATGFALSGDDQMWRQHSFVISPGNRLIETTTLRERYFGFVLNQAEANRFFVSNLYP